MPDSEEVPIRPRLVLLGSGFATVILLDHVKRGLFDITVISPRNHFVFTPLLPSTTVGTIEFRSVIEPVRHNRKGIRFLLAEASSLDAKEKRVICRDLQAHHEFSVPYDLLVIGVGAVNNTFGTPGVSEHAFFLKEVRDARRIRNRIITCLEQACLPETSGEERKRLLHIAVVGGGPTGIEFAAELNDLLDDDLKKAYPEVAGQMRITLFEAGREILGAFDSQLRSYTKDHFRRNGIDVRLETPVAEVREHSLVLKTGEEVPAGLVVWSTGYAPTNFVSRLKFERDKAGRLLVDEFLRLPGAEGVHAAGDCAQMTGKALPQTAQVAMQQGKYLASAFTKGLKRKTVPPFKFVNLGMLAYIGENEALAEIPKAGLSASGVMTYLFWRSAYLTRLVSLKNKVLVLFDWAKAWVFGRDLSKF
jgi:NADH:ubiquinone reductase (non-electrogenic)